MNSIIHKNFDEKHKIIITASKNRLSLRSSYIIGGVYVNAVRIGLLMVGWKG